MSHRMVLENLFLDISLSERFTVSNVSLQKLDRTSVIRFFSAQKDLIFPQEVISGRFDIKFFETSNHSSFSKPSLGNDSNLFLKIDLKNHRIRTWKIPENMQNFYDFQGFFNKDYLLNSHAVGVRYCLRCRYMLVYKNRPSKMNFFWWQGILFTNFDLKNGYKNEFKDNNEKSCSWSRNKIPHEIDLEAH